MSKKHVVIIGAGFTGLTAAYRLLKKGFAVTILERTDTIGGLAAGFSINGTSLEKAYHHLFWTDNSIRELVSELGAEELIEWHNSSIAIAYKNKIYPFMTPRDLLNFSPLSFINRLRAGISTLFLQYFPFGKALVGHSALEFMKVFAGNQVTEVIWKPLLKGKFHEYYDKVSMAWLWARLHTRANSKKPGESVEKLGYPKGGFIKIIELLQKEIVKLGGIIETNITIEKIDYDDKSQNATITYNSVVHTYDSCLFTGPSQAFEFLTKDSLYMTTEYQSKLQSIPYLGAVLIVFTSKQSLSEYYWHNINQDGAPFLVFIQHTNLITSTEYENTNVYYIGAYVPHNHNYFTDSDDQIKEKWYSYLKNLFPNFDISNIESEWVFKFKNAQHIVDTQYLEHVPGRNTPIPSVYLSNFTQIFPEDRGTNFAVREGNAIAETIAQSLNNQ